MARPDPHPVREPHEPRVGVTTPSPGLVASGHVAPDASLRYASRPLPTVAASGAALLLRLSLGAVILPHGAQKVLGAFGGPGWSGTIAFFEQSFQMPAVVAVLVMCAEFLGSIGLLFGFLTRFCALGIAAVMVGAVVLVHWRVGFFMDWQDQQHAEGFEYHLLAIGIALALMVLGGGRWSLDRLLWRRLVRPA